MATSSGSRVSAGFAARQVRYSSPVSVGRARLETFLAEAGSSTSAVGRGTSNASFVHLARDINGLGFRDDRVVYFVAKKYWSLFRARALLFLAADGLGNRVVVGVRGWIRKNAVNRVC